MIDMTSVLFRMSLSFSLSLTYMYTHTKWLPYSPLSLKTCNCSTINDIKHFPRMHEFKSASFTVQHSPKDTNTDSHTHMLYVLWAFTTRGCHRYRQNKKASSPFFHSCICMCELSPFQLFFVDMLRVWRFSCCVGFCVSVWEKERKR